MSNLTSTQQDNLNALPADQDGMLDFGDLARNVLNQQCQYASRFVGGLAGTPDLASDLRTDGDPTNYHSLRIHQDDAETFIQRVNTYRHQANNGLL